MPGDGFLDPLGDLDRRLAERPQHLRRRPDGTVVMVRCSDPECCSQRGQESDGSE